MWAKHASIILSLLTIALAGCGNDEVYQMDLGDLRAEANPNAPVDAVRALGGSCIFNSEGNVQTIHFKSRTTDSDLKSLSELDNLETLHNLTLYSSDHITDDGLKYLPRFSGIVYLALPPQTTAVGLSHLEDLPELKALALNGATVSSKEVDEISKFSRLQLLTLRNCTFTDADLKRLEGCITLKEIHLEGTAVTDSGIESFVAAVPDCKIVR